jgi:hypothetical protein
MGPVPAILALLAPLALCGIVAVLALVPIPDGPAVHLLDVALGWLGGITVNVYGYWFGSSHGSRERDRSLAERREGS